MDRKGFETLKQTFDESEIGKVEITPEPEDGEDVKHVTIRPYDRTRTAPILNVLDKAGLLYDDSKERAAADTGKPSLKYLNTDAFAVTLEDKNSQ